MRNRRSWPLPLTAVFFVVPFVCGQQEVLAKEPSGADASSHSEASLSDQPSADEVPLYDNVGDHRYPITTAKAGTQAYFDQGLRLYHAFNHAEAIRAFRAAQRLDPDCAMCWWGEALAFGPNINLPMDQDSGRSAYAALQGALVVHA